MEHFIGNITDTILREMLKIFLCWHDWFCLVYATMRNLAKKERLLECVKGLHKDTLEILQMDVTDRQSILDARDRVVEKRLDILGML